MKKRVPLAATTLFAFSFANAGACGKQAARDETSPSAASKPATNPVTGPVPQTASPPAASAVRNDAANLGTEPPPPGVTARDDGLWIQTCDKPMPCPKLTQPLGAKHCDASTLGGRDDWRLPTRQEVESFRRIDSLSHREGYHFTSSLDDGNAALVWIVDPTTTQPTTIPPTRKPFTIRCVSDRG